MCLQMISVRQEYYMPYNGKLFALIIFICGLMSRVFANSLGDRGSIPGRVILKTQKMVLGAA